MKNLTHIFSRRLFNSILIGIFCFLIVFPSVLGNSNSNVKTKAVPQSSSVNGSSDPIGNEWPMFHQSLNHTGNGPVGSSTNVNKLWGFLTSNNIDSSPAVSNGCVYIGSFDDSIYCLNASSGSKLWSYPTGGSVICSPAVAGDYVYFGSEDENFYCLQPHLS